MRALHKKKSVKAIVISGISLLLVAAIVVGVLWYLGHRSEPVKVAPVSMFMGWLSNESTQSGNVTSWKTMEYRLMSFSGSIFETSMPPTVMLPF